MTLDSYVHDTAFESNHASPCVEKYTLLLRTQQGKKAREIRTERVNHKKRKATNRLRNKAERDAVLGRGCQCMRSFLNEIGDIEGHLVNLGVVELFDIPQHPDIFSRNKVDGDTLPSKSSTTSNTMDVVLPICREIVVDNE